MLHMFHGFFKKSSSAKKLIEKITGATLLPVLPHGLNPILDIRYKVNGIKLNTIFDVGANLGQSENEFKSLEPKSDIYCFEPIHSTYEELKKNVSSTTQVFNFAFGDKEESFEINLDSETSPSNSLNNKEGSGESALKAQIEVKTLNKFLDENKIDNINLLKIDTEGFDLKVLKGADNYLKNSQIDFIITEVSMNTYNDFHVPYTEVLNYMQSFGYEVFGIYEQQQEFINPRPVLRRSNVMFISPKMANNI